MDKSTFNKGAWENVEKYLGLDIAGKKVKTPYYVNQIGTLLKSLGVEDSVIVEYNSGKYSYGLFRGKGRPEELVEAVLRIAQEKEYELDKADAKAISEIMKLHGLGVDCSGFVYNVVGGDVLDPILDWQDPNVRTVYRAGAFTFAGSVSELLKPDQVESGDLILKKDRNGKYDHVALVLQNDEGLVVCQSTRMSNEPGVGVTGLRIIRGNPEFEFKPCFEDAWEQQFQDGRLEFRRLKLS